MVTLERLHLIADCLGVKVHFKDLNKNYTGLLGKADASKKEIILDISLKDNRREQKCVLAEEIGHILYPPRPGHIAYHARGYYDYDSIKRSMINAFVAQDERMALDWATNALIPDVEFWRAIKEGNNMLYELQEYFSVTEWFMRLKISYISRKSLDYKHRLKWNDIIKRG